MNNEENYTMRDSPAVTDTDPWTCQLCERIGNYTTVQFTDDPAAEICNDCWNDCQSTN